MQNKCSLQTDCNLATECSNTGTNYEPLLPFMVQWSDTGHNEVRSVTRRKIPGQNFVNTPWAVLNMKYDKRLIPVILNASAHFQWISHMEQRCSWQSSYAPLYDNSTYAWISLHVFRLKCWTYILTLLNSPAWSPHLVLVLATLHLVWKTYKRFNWHDLCEMILFWSEVKWIEVGYGEVLVDKNAVYITVTLYWRYFSMLWLFHLGTFCIVFVIISTVVVLYCFVMCGCAYW